MGNRFATRGVRFSSRAPRRATQWVGSTDETAVTTLAASSAVLDQSFGFSEPATIVRVRGALWIASDQLSATERPFGAIGFATVTDQALAIGITAVPIPILDSPSEQWLLWQPFFTDFTFLNSTGAVTGNFKRFDLDSKAMRKMNDGTSVVVVLQNASTVGLDFLLEFRMLVKLHG